MTHFGEDMEQQSPSYIAEKGIKLHNHFVDQLNSFSPSLHISTYDSGTPFLGFYQREIKLHIFNKN